MNNKNKMCKTESVSILQQNGVSLGNEITFSSKNKSVDIYWANPNFKVLNTDWSLILNNWVERKLIVFNIPKGSIKTDELILRSDEGKEELIEMRIIVNGSSYTENRSKLSFSKYLVDIIPY